MHFLNSHNILSLIIRNFQKKKNEDVRCTLFQITNICFNKSDYATLHSVMRIMTENGTKMMQKV